ncbi:flagellin [Candidatus Nitronereus thalassa]|uniref:Flagellin n=1 Tax=Candidatus Nitronereus thalassa TaxID=3020898 RepID=A0ABU3K652_9BACT|nr:flagellin [Candidatus Nitronereus thalassa]MDT7041861.1 flagellin [Candidatus Nitronereus thalassa]
MRITQQQQINLILGQYQNQQGAFARVSEALSSGKKVNRPSDEPIAYEQILKFRNVLNNIEKRSLAVHEGASRLNLSENSIGTAGSIVQRAKEIALQQRNDTSSSAERQAVAKEVHQLLLSLRDAANTKINERYLFSGFETQTETYALSTSVSATGRTPTISANDDNTGTTSSTVAIQTAASLTGNEYKISFSDSTTFDVINLTTGATVLASQTYSSGANIDFDGLRTVLTDNPSGPLGGDEFQITAHNPSDATITASVTTPSALQPNIYEIRFTSTTAFDIVNLTDNQVLSTGNAYVSGANIVFAGITAVVTDGTVTPQPGDVFRVRPNYTYQGDTGSIAVEYEDGKTIATNVVGSQVFSGPSVDIFDALQDLEQALLTNSPSDLAAVITNLSTGLDQLTDARADIGSKVNRLDRIAEGLDLLAVTTQDERSAIEDTDFAEASSQLATLELNLQASLLTLNRQFQISLLNFLR